MDTTLGRYIVERRTLLGMKQGQLADRAGVQRAHLSQVESGKITLPSADFRRRLASALGVRHVDILVAAGELTAEEAGQDAGAVSTQLDIAMARIAQHLPDPSDVQIKALEQTASLWAEAADTSAIAEPSSPDAPSPSFPETSPSPDRQRDT